MTICINDILIFLAHLSHALLAFLASIAHAIIYPFSFKFISLSNQSPEFFLISIFKLLERAVENRLCNSLTLHTVIYISLSNHPVTNAIQLCMDYLPFTFTIYHLPLPFTHFVMSFVDKGKITAVLLGSVLRLSQLLFMYGQNLVVKLSFRIRHRRIVQDHLLSY